MAAALLVGCQSEKSTGVDGTLEVINEHGQVFSLLRAPLPDMDSLFRASVSGLVMVKKSAKLNHDSTGAEYKVKDPKIEIEALSILTELNRPAYRDLYLENTGKDQYSNLHVRRFLSVDGTTAVRTLEISYHPANGEIRRVTADIVRSNYLFDKRERMVIDFDSTPLRLSHVAVTGEQKVIGFSADRYEVRLELRYQQ